MASAFFLAALNFKNIPKKRMPKAALKLES